MENIYQTIRGRTKSPRTLESNSKDPLSAAKPYIIVVRKSAHFPRCRRLRTEPVSTQKKTPRTDKKHTNTTRKVTSSYSWYKSIFANQIPAPPHSRSVEMLVNNQISDYGFCSPSKLGQRPATGGDWKLSLCIPLGFLGSFSALGSWSGRQPPEGT